jgi:hypothetical protein
MIEQLEPPLKPGGRTRKGFSSWSTIINGICLDNNLKNQVRKAGKAMTELWLQETEHIIKYYTVI